MLGVGTSVCVRLGLVLGVGPVIVFVLGLSWIFVLLSPYSDCCWSVRVRLGLVLGSRFCVSIKIRVRVAVYWS